LPIADWFASDCHETSFLSDPVTPEYP
jgi:hypothetical protein